MKNQPGKKVLIFLYLRRVTTDLHDAEWESAHFSLLTWGQNWPFRCLDFIIYNIKFFSTNLSISGERVFDSLPSLHWFLTPCLSNPRQSLTLRDIPPNSLNYWPPLTEKGDTSPQLNIVKRQILTCFVCKSWAKFTNVARMTKFEC